MIDPAEWPSAEAANRAERLAYLGTGSCLESYRAANIAWVISGVASADYNGVIWPRLTGEEADQLSPILVDRFRMHQLPAIWHFDGVTQPADLASRLDDLGCHLLPPAIVAAAPIVDVTRRMRDLPQLTVERVTTREELSSWMDIWAQTTSEPRGPREVLYASLGLNRLEPLRHYLARLDRRPVGLSQVFFGQQAAGIHAVAVRADFQRLGIGSALIQRPLLEARTVGYELAVASPTAEGLPMFSALGFDQFESPFPKYRLWP
jgi:GNAT superfamily N-acetyltransferase